MQIKILLELGFYEAKIYCDSYFFVSNKVLQPVIQHQRNYIILYEFGKLWCIETSIQHLCITQISWNPFRWLEKGFLKFFSSNDLYETLEKKPFILQQTYLYIAALKLKSLKSIFVKTELSMDSCSHHHSSGLKSFKSTKFLF